MHCIRINSVDKKGRSAGEKGKRYQLNKINLILLLNRVALRPVQISLIMNCIEYGKDSITGNRQST